MVLPDSTQENALQKTNTNIEFAGNDKQISQISEWAKETFECDFFVGL